MSLPVHGSFPAAALAKARQVSSARDRQSRFEFPGCKPDDFAQKDMSETFSILRRQKSCVDGCPPAPVVLAASLQVSGCQSVNDRGFAVRKTSFRLPSGSTHSRTKALLPTAQRLRSFPCLPCILAVAILSIIFSHIDSLCSREMRC